MPDFLRSLYDLFRGSMITLLYADKACLPTGAR
jgi:hypothetical protein